MSDPDLPPLLALAFDLCDLADEITLGSFRAPDLEVGTKPDRTFVTEADRSAERAIRDGIARVRPDDVVSGEEYGHLDGGDFRWIVDPIDGTNNYLRGVPVWATLLALEVHGDLAVAVVSAPALHRRWWATRGSGAFMTDEGGAVVPLRVSSIADLSDAHVLYSSDGVAASPLARGYEQLQLRSWRSRGFGDFWQHMLVAEGAAEVAIDPVGLQEYDLAAPRLVVEEAGGRLTDLAGIATARGGAGISTNGLLHDEVLAILHTN